MPQGTLPKPPPTPRGKKSGVRSPSDVGNAMIHGNLACSLGDEGSSLGGEQIQGALPTEKGKEQ